MSSDLLINVVEISVIEEEVASFDALEDGGGVEPVLVDEGVHVGELATLHFSAGVAGELRKNRIASLSIQYMRRENEILDI